MPGLFLILNARRSLYRYEPLAPTLYIIIGSLFRIAMPMHHGMYCHRMTDKLEPDFAFRLIMSRIAYEKGYRTASS